METKKAMNVKDYGPRKSIDDSTKNSSKGSKLIKLAEAYLSARMQALSTDLDCLQNSFNAMATRCLEEAQAAGYDTNEFMDTVRVLMIAENQALAQKQLATKVANPQN